MTEIDDHRVLALTPSKIRGKSSGAVLEEAFACVVTIDGGKITRTVLYPSREEALQAARTE